MTLTQQQLIKEEKGFWQGLNDPKFYGEHMATDALAVINGQVMTQQDAVNMTKERPMTFADVQFKNERFLQLDEHVAAVVYEATAKSDGGTYASTITSVYAERGGKPVLVLTTHAMTPEQAGAWHKQLATAGTR
jgi:hypothetical protein